MVMCRLGRSRTADSGTGRRANERKRLIFSLRLSNGKPGHMGVWKDGDVKVAEVPVERRQGGRGLLLLDYMTPPMHRYLLMYHGSAKEAAENLPLEEDKTFCDPRISYAVVRGADEEQVCDILAGTGFWPEDVCASRLSVEATRKMPHASRGLLPRDGEKYATPRRFACHILGAGVREHQFWIPPEERECFRASAGRP